MAKHSYIENDLEAWCSECTFRCIPEPEEDTQFNIYYLSRCCSASIVDENKKPWIAITQEGSPEP